MSILSLFERISNDENNVKNINIENNNFDNINVENSIWNIEIKIST